MIPPARPGKSEPARGIVFELGSMGDRQLAIPDLESSRGIRGHGGTPTPVRRRAFDDELRMVSKLMRMKVVRAHEALDAVALLVEVYLTGGMVAE